MRNDGQTGGDEAAKVGTITGPVDDEDCITYLEASCRTVPSLLLQKCKAAGLDSMVQSSETVDPIGAPISCWFSETDGGTVHNNNNKKKGESITSFANVITFQAFFITHTESGPR